MSFEMMNKALDKTYKALEEPEEENDGEVFCEFCGKQITFRRDECGNYEPIPCSCKGWLE